jgi:hypothetical protein
MAFDASTSGIGATDALPELGVAIHITQSLFETFLAALLYQYNTVGMIATLT